MSLNDICACQCVHKRHLTWSWHSYIKAHSMQAPVREVYTQSAQQPATNHLKNAMEWYGMHICASKKFCKDACSSLPVELPLGGCSKSLHHGWNKIHWPAKQINRLALSLQWSTKSRAQRPKFSSLEEVAPEWPVWLRPTSFGKVS